MTNSQIPLPARRQGPCQGAVRPPAPGMPSGDPKEMEWHPYGNPEPWHGPLDGLTTSTFAFHNGLGAISSERHLDASGQPSTPISTGQPTRRCFLDWALHGSRKRRAGVLWVCVEFSSIAKFFQDHSIVSEEKETNPMCPTLAKLTFTEDDLQGLRMLRWIFQDFPLQA